MSPKPQISGCLYQQLTSLNQLSTLARLFFIWKLLLFCDGIWKEGEMSILLNFDWFKFFLSFFYSYWSAATLNSPFVDFRVSNYLKNSFFCLNYFRSSISICCSLDNIFSFCFFSLSKIRLILTTGNWYYGISYESRFIYCPNFVCMCKPTMFGCGVQWLLFSSNSSIIPLFLTPNFF